MDKKFVFMPDLMKGVVTPQEGEVGVNHENATARIAKDNENIGIHKISPEEMQRLEKMSMSELELEAQLIANEIERRMKRGERVAV